MAECLCVRSMGGRELAVIMALVLSMTGHLRGRRSSAGCGGRRCCSNVLCELALFVSVVVIVVPFVAVLYLLLLLLLLLLL